MSEPTGTLADLVPDARVKVEELLAVAEAMGFGVKLRGAGRTCADQAKLAAQGDAVTRANLCRSWHVLGRAVDLTLVPDTCAAYTALGEAWEAMGGVWGGRWLSYGPCGDAGHFHWAKQGAVPTSVCPEDLTLAECEALRLAYLGQAFAPPAASPALLAAGLVAAGGLLWWWLR